MGLNAIKNAIIQAIKSNADSVNVIKDRKNVSASEVRCIYQGKNVTVWQKQKYYYITFNSNGGTGSMAQQTMPSGAVAALSANLFSRVGYLFSGWNTDAGGDVLYTDKQEVQDVAAAGETAILYAIWKAITWYVKFNANGGSGSMANQAHAYDAEQALSANAFTRSGYSLLGWGTTAAGSVAYADKQSVKNLKSVHGAVLNLYALWKRDTTVLFDTNDENIYQWYRGGSANNGWGLADDVSDMGVLSPIDCTDYTTCTVRINGAVTSTPSGATVNNTYIRIGFTDDYTNAITVVNKWNNDTGASGQNGLAYNTWYDLVLDVSALDGYQALNVFIGGSYNNGGYLYCSKITMSAE